MCTVGWMELDKSKRAVENLQRMLWGLESFRVLDITLASTLEVLNRAKKDFEHTMKEVTVPIFGTCGSTD